MQSFSIFSALPLPSVTVSVFVSQVEQHRTEDTFGRALIPLYKEEYRWLNRFIYHRHSFPCGDAELFFSNNNGGLCGNLLESFQASWKRFGLPGTPTFTLIRTSISTCVSPVLQSVTATLLILHRVDELCRYRLNSSNSPAPLRVSFSQLVFCLCRSRLLWTQGRSSTSDG